jgi:hypothetical protein
VSLVLPELVAEAPVGVGLPSARKCKRESERERERDGEREGERASERERGRVLNNGRLR